MGCGFLTNFTSKVTLRSEASKVTKRVKLELRVALLIDKVTLQVSELKKKTLN